MQLPVGYVPLAEAWPEWLSRRFPNTRKRLFDPETYRPQRMGGSWEYIGPDPITGEFREEPEQRIKDYAATVPDFSATTEHDVRMIECEFWQSFCRKDTGAVNAIIERDGKWHALRFDEWNMIRKELWSRFIAGDPERKDWGPRKWMTLAMGEKIPIHVAVHRQAFSDFLADGPDFRELPYEERIAPQPVTLPAALAGNSIKAEKTKTLIVAGLLRENPQLGKGTNSAAIDEITRVAREGGFFSQKESISIKTLQRARKL